MKTWKAILALLLVACLFVTLFAACANNETPSTDQGATSGDKTPSSGNNDSGNKDSNANDTPSTGDEEDPGEETYAPEDYVDINIWMNSSMTNEEHINAVLEAVNAIIGPKIGVQIADVTMLGMGQYNSQIALAIANGEKIDLAACTPLPGSSLSALVSNGSAMPYTEYAKEYAPEYLEMMAKMLPGLTFGGELYGITAYRQKSTNQYLWWKTEHAERLGIQDELLNMKTWADLDAIAPKLLDEGFVLFGDKKCVYDGYYIMDPQNIASYGYESLGDGFRLIYAEGDKVGCLYENEDFVNSLKLFADWNAKGYIHPDTALNQETSNSSFVKDDIMFFSLSASEFGGEATFEYQVEAPITVRSIGEGVLATIDAQVWSYFIPVTCEEPEATLKFVNEMYTNAMIADATQEGIKLTLIWFALWKNGGSNYVPKWVKLDRKKYWVCVEDVGTKVSRRNSGANTISPLCEEAVAADAKAFATLMKHINEVDEHGTVILMQVENEIGLLGSDRDYSDYANARFAEQVPAAVAQEFGVSGTWSEAFGDDAGEYFMAWSYGNAVEKIASAGQKEHQIPMYVNAWLEQYPDRAGAYPSGGPIAKMMKMWRLAAPTLCMFAPDIYVPDFEKVAAEYTANGNPLFIPETNVNVRSASSVFLAVCEYNAIGFNPFGIENVFGPPSEMDGATMAALNIDPSVFSLEGSAVYLPASYKLIQSMMHLIVPARGTQHMRGFYHNGFDGGQIFEFEEYDVHISYGRDVPGKPPAAGAVLEVAPNEFYVFGTNFRAEFLPKKGESKFVRTLRIEEGCFENGVWERDRILNGDEHRIALPFEPQIRRVELHKD